MQVTETLRDGLKRGYEIKLSAAELEAKVQRESQQVEGGTAAELPEGQTPPALTAGERDARQLVLAAAQHDSLRAASVLRAWLGEAR